MRRRKGRLFLMTVAVLAIVALGAAAARGFDWHHSPAVPTASQTEQASTATIRRETLVDYATVNGAVGYGTAWPVTSKATGTITWLPAVGTTISRGQALLRVDDAPVVLLYGSIPMYRPLTTGVTGNDVLQFEQNLQALGYQGFPVDHDYDEATAAAVRRWQSDLHLPQTGTVQPGRISYAAAALRVDRQLVRVGGDSPADAFTATGTTKVVTATVDSGAAAWAVTGAKVDVVLPSGVSVPGVVAAVGQSNTAAGASIGSGSGGSGDPGSGGATDPGGSGGAAGPGGLGGSGGAADDAAGGAAAAGAGRGASGALVLTITIKDQKALDSGGAGSLTVRFVRSEKKDVLTVPVPALLALAAGGYGLEIVADDGSSRVVAVRAGMFAQGRVEVSGSDIVAGMTVRMPR